MDPKRAARLCESLAAKVRAGGVGAIDLVASPAMGGVVVGYEMARQLGVPSIFYERVDGKLVLRRGFDIRQGCPRVDGGRHRDHGTVVARMH